MYSSYSQIELIHNLSRWSDTFILSRCHDNVARSAVLLINCHVEDTLNKLLFGFISRWRISLTPYDPLHDP